VSPEQLTSARECYCALVAIPLSYLTLKAPKEKNLLGGIVSHLGLVQRLLKSINQKKHFPKNAETSGNCQSITAKEK